MRQLRGIAAAALLLSCGCLKFEQQLTLKEDGSGTLEISYSLAEQTVAQVEAMNKLRRELVAAAGTNAPTARPAGFDSFLFNPQKGEIVTKLKEYEPRGIVVEKMELKSLDIRRNVNIKIRFNSLAEFAKTDFFQAFGFSVTKDAQGNYVLERPPSHQTPAVRPDMSDPETLRVLSPLLNGFSVSFTVNSPARILRTTAPITTPYSASWRFDFDRDPDALMAMQSQCFQLVVDGNAIKLPEIQLPARDKDRSGGGK